MSHSVLRIALAAFTGMSAAIGFANDFPAVGACPAGGNLSIVTTGPYKGRAFDLTKDEAFRAKYSGLIGDPEHWSAKFMGPAEQNRKYVGPKGTLVVFFTCEARNCGAAELYGVIDERTGAIGVRVTENGKYTVKGESTEVVNAAITCAAALDQQAKKRVAERYK
jgi:hypothetical protein